MQDDTGPVDPDISPGIASPRRRINPPRPFSAAGLGALLSGGAVALFSGDFACAAIGAALLAACACGLVALLVRSIFRNHPRWAWTHVVMAALIAAIVQTAMIRQTLRNDAFQQAFQVDPPPTIANLRVERFYAGGPGDTLTLMRFQCDPVVIRQLVARLPANMEDGLAGYRDKTMSWQRAWDTHFQIAKCHANDWWLNAPAMARPHAYQGKPALNDTAMGSTTIVWDDDTGEVYVLILVG